MPWDPKKTYQEAEQGKVGAVLNVAGAGVPGAVGALKDGNVEKAAVSVGTAGLSDIDNKFNNGKIGKTLANMNPLKAPKLKDVPDPTAPANLERPSMGSMQAGTVNQPGVFNAATIATVKDPKAALIDQSQQAQFRDQQSTLAAQLANQAAGIGPSVSGMQLKQGQEANLAATMAQQNSMRGGANPAMARATMQTAAEIQGKAAQEAAQSRLQEQLAAQGLLNQVASGGREQDIGLATSQANLTQQVNLAKYQGDLQLAVEQGKLDQQTASMMFEQANQNARLDAELGQKFQQLTAQYASMGLDADKANMLASLEIEKMKSGAIQAQNANTLAADNANKQLLGNAAGAGAGALAVASDENLKSDIKDGGKKISEFLDAVGSHDYVYKNEKFGEGRFVSPMAQELEKSEVGKSMVINTPEGKMVDYQRGLGTIVAAQSTLHKRLKKLEGKK